MLEVTRSPVGKRLLICSPADGFGELREAASTRGSSVARVRTPPPVEADRAPASPGRPGGVERTATGNSPTTASVHETRRDR